MHVQNCKKNLRYLQLLNKFEASLRASYYVVWYILVRSRLLMLALIKIFKSAVKALEAKLPILDVTRNSSFLCCGHRLTIEPKLH